MSLLVLPWLLVCAISDLRTRTVPTWLTVVPLLGATAWIAWQGAWPLALLILTLVLSMTCTGARAASWLGCRGYCSCSPGSWTAWLGCWPV